MQNKSKKLIIMASAIKEGILFDENEVLLALTLLTMESAKKAGLKYITTEDLYPRKLIKRDEDLFQSEMRDWLHCCDNIFKEKINYECSFSGNGYWFFARFESLHYISKLAKVILENYERIEVDTPENSFKNINPVASLKDLSFLSFGAGLDHFIYFLIKALKVSKPLHLRSENFNIKKNKLNSPVIDFIKRLPEITKRRSVKAISKFLKKKIIKRETYWMPQEGYDVEKIKDHFPQYNYINISKVLIGNNYNYNKIETADDEWQKINSFIEKFHANLAEVSRKFVKDYINNVVACIPQVAFDVKRMLNVHEPKAVIYALGSANVVDQIIGKVASDYKVPLYYFKHGGIENAFLRDSILDEYFEYSSFLKRTHFFHSSIEIKKFDNPEIYPKILSPKENYKIDIDRVKRNRKILYSVGPPSNWSFKDLFKYCLDSERQLFIDFIIRYTKLHNKMVDVKVHPAEWHRSYEYFKLLNHNCGNRFNILAGGSIERLFNSYGIVIIDIFCTKVFSALLYSNMPIIAWKPEGVELNAKFESLLRNRVHVISSYHELENALNLFYNGKLSYDFEEFNELVFGKESLLDLEKYLKETIFK